MNKYKVILADPPWHFKTRSDKGMDRSADNHYPTMSKEDIQNLNVQSLADKDCVLFLWVTFPCLEEGLELIKEWGFEYKTCAFNWVKRNKKASFTPLGIATLKKLVCKPWDINLDGLISWFWGMGYWTRANSELCLLATKGSPKRVSSRVHQIVDDRILRHSEKPNSVRERIVELMGDVPRVELFAREQVNGWDTIGNEIDGRDMREVIGVRDD